MKKDDRTFIKVHNGMPESDKIAGLSDRAFRRLIEVWCWCSRAENDGRFRVATWKKQVAESKIRVELETELAHQHGHDCPKCPYVPVGWVLLHDFLEHQSSAAEIDAKREKKRGAGRKGNHEKWHAARGLTDPDCEFCCRTGDPPEVANGSQVRSQVRSQDGRKTSPETETEKRTTTHLGGSAPDSTTRENAPPTGDAEPEHPPDGDEPPEEPLPPPGRGASGPTASDAHRLVRRVLGTGLGSTVLTDLAIRAATLLREFDEPTVAEALTEWGNRVGVGPGVLPSLVADVVKRRNGATNARAAPVTAGAARPSTTDVRVAAVQALKARRAAAAAGSATTAYAALALPPGGAP